MMEKNITIKRDIPIIKGFVYRKQFYVYDTYTNRIIGVSKEQFQEICLLQNIGITKYIELNKENAAYEDVRMLINKGMLKSNFIKKVEHPCTEDVSILIQRCVNDVILQVKKDCNFCCRYCGFASSGMRENEHKKQEMSWEVAKKSIDFLYEHSCDVKEIKIAFYGGEPLLNFELIKRVVNYANNRFMTKRIRYTMTINGSILTDEIIKFIIQNNFYVSISLDGDKEIQDKHRKLRISGKGTFDIVYQNVLKLKELDNEYFDNNISFLPVLFDDENYQRVEKFFQKLNVKKILPLNAGMNGIDYVVHKVPNDVDWKKAEGINNYFVKYGDIYKEKKRLTETWHHNGPCIAGIGKVFVDTEGNMYPCEKVVQTPFLLVGNVDRGLNINKVTEFMNIGLLSEEECKTCWAMRFCNLCIDQCYDMESQKLSKERKLDYCRLQKKKVMEFFESIIEQ